MDPYPSSPGFKEHSGTSEEAARAMAPTASTIRDQVLASLADSSGTTDEIAARLGLSILSVRPRFSELFGQEKIYKGSRKRRNDSGKLAVVWHVGKKPNGDEITGLEKPEDFT